MIYFDNAATSFPKPEEVYQAVNKAMRVYGANPGRSGHKLALQAGRVVFETKELLWERLAEIKGIKVYGPGDFTCQSPVISLNMDKYDSSEAAFFRPAI